jgi:glycosyltransferase involved in cell wall biosynthesis
MQIFECFLVFLVLDFLLYSCTLIPMHIIVDIRTTGPQDTSIVRAGRAWADMWQQHKSEDTISYLIYEHQDRFSDQCIVASRSLWPLTHKRIRPKTGNEVFRCVSFSPLSPYDTSIATTLHVVSNAVTLYPDEATGSIARRVSEWLRKRSLQSATTLIVPDIQIGRELVELYDIDEESIEIIPHLPLRTLSGDTAPIQRIDTPVPYFIYDGGYAGESNILTLLAAWERYRRDGGRYELLLLGPALSHLSLLTHMIRSLDLVSSVRYLGYLDDASLAPLYSGAKGWIYV